MKIDYEKLELIIGDLVKDVDGIWSISSLEIGVTKSGAVIRVEVIDAAEAGALGVTVDPRNKCIE